MNGRSSTWEQAVTWLRGQPGREAMVRDCYFDDPLIDAARRFHNSLEWREVRRRMPKPPGRVLDVGAGRGISSYALAMDGWETVALEPDGSDLVGAGAIRQLARDAGLKIHVIEQTAESLPFGDRTFDLVYGRQFLHHAVDLPAVCREIFRVLRPRGRFIATREHVISKQDDLAVFLEAHPLHKFYGGEHACRLDEYRSAFRCAGLRLDRVLNPYASPINLFPDSEIELKRRLACRLGWPWPSSIPCLALTLLGAITNTPGRLYTFIGHRHDD